MGDGMHQFCPVKGLAQQDCPARQWSYFLAPSGGQDNQGGSRVRHAHEPEKSSGFGLVWHVGVDHNSHNAFSEGRQQRLGIPERCRWMHSEALPGQGHVECFDDHGGVVDDEDMADGEHRTSLRQIC
jgi:hypothetical protein